MVTSSTSSFDAARLTRRRLVASAGTLAFAILLLDVAGATAAAAPPVHTRISDGTLIVNGTPFGDHITLRVDASDATTLECLVEQPLPC